MRATGTSHEYTLRFGCDVEVRIDATETVAINCGVGHVNTGVDRPVYGNGILGEGGMGVVYAAYDDRLGRPVAIKTIKGAASEPEAAERMRREARAAAKVNHPGICQLYEIGEENGELFLAMELLQGSRWRQGSARGPIAVPEVGSIALGMLAGMEALHAEGLIHRDLKPSNIFMTPHGVKLLDFGLTVTMQSVADDADRRLDDAGDGPWNPSVCRAGAAPQRGDRYTGRIFAAGAVIFEMLTGKPRSPASRQSRCSTRSCTSSRLC